MKYVATYLFLVSLASAFIISPDTVLIEGRILIVSSRPLDSYPWDGEKPRLSEHPVERVSDSREIEAMWEIKDGRLYLVAISAFRFDGSAPSRSLGIRDLMPERVRDGRVFADWFTGEFKVLERSRGDMMSVDAKVFSIVQGEVSDMPNQSPQPSRL